ncbi:hypothetical protein [Cohnella faecalis]|uniref:Right handed beta helix domain-containing protein n=2 Tax=Cohnella faecalis TaxID=2315694 RepID=A0A398D220_9BACL|nr:hypothetical protein [Cohnella faecalis]RIE05154.1 hypothetical protein D3H35_01935 [Cohnella faecalis]
MTFHGAGATDTTGSQPLAYEFAVNCDAVGIDAYGTFWPVIMRRYCSHYVTERCKLTNPTEVIIGGTGYLTQQIYCLYGHVRDCLTSNGRHLNDFTGSAYCYVENCHADGDDLGAYVTHGQYEHDLTYVGNSGLMSFGNSGPTWGESAKRITVKKHVGSWFLAFRKITDLTLEDVHVFVREGVENSADTGSFWLNADGLQMKNCTAEAMVKFMQVSSRSKRPNIIENCSFTLTKHRRLSHDNVDAELTFRNCVFDAIDGNRLEGKGGVRFQHCRLNGAGPQSAPIRVAGEMLSVRGGSMRDTGFMLIGDGAQRVDVGSGAVVSGTNSERAFFRRDGLDGGAAEWRLFDYTSRAEDSVTRHYTIGGKSNTYVANGATFEGGRFEAALGAFEDGGYMLHAANVELDVDRNGLPEQNDRIKHLDGNLIIDSRKERMST